ISSSPSSKPGLPAAGAVHAVSATAKLRDALLTRRPASATAARSPPCSASAPEIFSTSTVAPVPRRPAVQVARAQRAVGAAAKSRSSAAADVRAVDSARAPISRDAELLLQAGGGGGVLENQPLARIDVVVRLLRHQRAFVEARQDELELA